jgi:hypothetical protein
MATVMDGKSCGTCACYKPIPGGTSDGRDGLCYFLPPQVVNNPEADYFSSRRPTVDEAGWGCWHHVPKSPPPAANPAPQIPTIVPRGGGAKPLKLPVGDIHWPAYYDLTVDTPIRTANPPAAAPVSAFHAAIDRFLADPTHANREAAWSALDALTGGTGATYGYRGMSITAVPRDDDPTRPPRYALEFA